MVKRKTTKKRSTTKKTKRKSSHEESIERVLIENFMSCVFQGIIFLKKNEADILSRMIKVGFCVIIFFPKPIIVFFHHQTGDLPGPSAFIIFFIRSQAVNLKSSFIPLVDKGVACKWIQRFLI